MTKLAHKDLALHKTVPARAAAAARPLRQERSHTRVRLPASVRLIGKTVILAIEVAEIVGFGLALL
jgi:hypothetical protein